MPVMLVTGAGRGIGAAIARTAAKHGWDVGINYSRSERQAEEVARDIRALGRSAVVMKADVAREDDVARMFSMLDAELGPLSALVNNAAIDHTAYVVDSSPTDLERVLRVNVVGPWMCAREAVRRMSTARGGTGGVIINISSVGARTGGLPRDVMYVTSKGALDAFSLGLAKEVGRDGIRVVSVRPGITRTEIFSASEIVEVEEVAQRDTAMGRIAEPSEIAECVVWLCSAAAGYITCTLYDVSGGR